MSKIAFLHPHLPAGGATIFLLNLGGELVQRGVPIQVFCLTETNPLAPDFERRHIQVSTDRSKDIIFEDRISSVLQRMARFRPGVVVANIDYEAGEVLRYLPGGIFRIAVIHAFSQIERAAPYAGAIDSVIAVSKHVAEAMAQIPTFSHLPIQCLELGVPIPPEVNREGLTAGHPLRILYLGRLEESAKRVRLFPVILERLRNSKIPFVWTIAGEGPERQFLESSLVTGNESQRIHFTGRVSYSKVPQLLAEHDVVLLTSDSEVFPLSLHEGMAAGLVPVVSDLPGRIREIVTPATGILVPPSDPFAYADGIIWLHLHREKMRAMSAQARQMIGQEYSVEAMADRWLPVLSRARGESPSWPTQWELSRPLFAPHAWRFSRPVRGLRRWAARGRYFFSGRFWAKAESI